MSFKGFSSGGHFAQRSESILATLIEGYLSFNRAFGLTGDAV